MEDVESPLPNSTPLLLVKPPVGLSTPAVFKALDLKACSTADPKQLLSGAASVTPGIMDCTQVDIAIPISSDRPDTTSMCIRLMRTTDSDSNDCCLARS